VTRTAMMDRLCQLWFRCEDGKSLFIEMAITSLG